MMDMLHLVLSTIERLSYRPSPRLPLWTVASSCSKKTWSALRSVWAPPQPSCRKPLRPPMRANG